MYSCYLLDKINSFRKEYPNIEITIITGPTTYLLNQLEIHKVDFIIDTAPVINMNSDFTIRKIKDLEFAFIALNEDKFKNIKSIKELENESVILPLVGTFNRSNLDEVFLKNNVKLNNVINIHTSEMIVGTVKKDLGIGYIIKDVVRDNLLNKEFILVDVKEKLPRTEINLVYIERYLTMVPRYFIENYLHIEIK